MAFLKRSSYPLSTYSHTQPVQTYTHVYICVHAHTHKKWSGMMVLGEQKHKDFCEFEANLVYTESSRLAKAT